MPEPPQPEDPLASLRASVADARRAAERLAAQAGAAAPGPKRAPKPGAARSARPRRAQASEASQTPAAGWDAEHGSGETTGEIQALAELVDSLRALLPEDLREQLNELIRQVLLLLRAVIDWLVARIERDAPGREIEIEDIPIS